MKPAQQERSRETHARIVAAAERLLSRGRAWAELTVAELVAEADASVGAFYNRFRDKDALLHVLQLELYTQGAATAQKAHDLAGSAVPVEVMVRAFVGVAIASYREQRGLGDWPSLRASRSLQSFQRRSSHAASAPEPHRRDCE